MVDDHTFAVDCEQCNRPLHLHAGDEESAMELMRAHLAEVHEVTDLSHPESHTF